MDSLFIIKGIIVGISVSAPLGPLGILCIQRTLNKGVFSGIITGLGAAFADSFYAAIAGFGISIIADFLKEYQLLIRIVGGIILIILGIVIFRNNPIKQIRQQKNQNIIGYFISGLFITFTNPITIVVFGAVFTGLGLHDARDTSPILFTLIGIFSGAVLWWSGLSIFLNIFRNKFRLRYLWWINKISGIMVSVFGLAIVLSMFFVKHL
ncbi:MAG: LysE family transporter [Bacteroidales bacterium]